MQTGSTEFKKEHSRIVNILFERNPESCKYFLDAMVHCYLTTPDVFSEIMSNHLEEPDITKNVENIISLSIREDEHQ